MPVTIYADTLLFINIFVTYFLLLCTGLICRAPLHRLRILLASFFGGAYALILLLPPLPAVLSVLLRVIACAVLRLIADGYGNLRRYLRGLLVFLAVNFVFAGLMLGLSVLLSPQTFLCTAGALYMDVDIPFLLCATAIAYAILRLCSALSGSRLPQTHYGVCTLFIGEKSVQGKGIFDTGHTLTDSFTGKPVLIAEHRLVQSLVPDGVSDFLTGKPLAECVIPDAWKSRLRLFPYSSIGGDGLLPAFRCDKAVFIHLNRSAVQENLYIAVSAQPLRDCEVLFPGALYDEMGEAKDDLQDTRPQKTARTHSPVFHRAVRTLHQRCADAPGTAAQKRRGAGAGTTADGRRKCAGRIDRT